MDYKIHINGLAPGKYEYEFEVTGELFGEFGNTQVTDAQIIARIVLEKGSGWMNAVCNIAGVVTVECDRCLDELEIPLDCSANLAIRSAKLGEKPESSDEFIIVDPSEAELDMKQFIYDYICVSLPLKKVHPDGKCNPEMLRRLEKMKGNPEAKDSDNYSPFAGLKELIKNK